MNYRSIDSTAKLEEFCGRLQTCDVIGFDTEFVSEDCYRPELCLIQVAADDELAVIDPCECGDTTAFWNILSETSATVIAHAAREEIRFAYRHTARKIANLFDTQLAAGFVGIEYPASLGTLVHRLIGEQLPKGETRTDWRKRPLTSDQIRYALSDVTNLRQMWTKLTGKVKELDREAWLGEETNRLQEKVIAAETDERWHRVSGSSGLKPRQMEILRHLWRWRESIAKNRDRIPKRILRDDLMVELAKRGSSDVNKVRGIRGMERRGLREHYDDIAAAIHAAWQVEEADLPKRARGRGSSASPMLSQFLSTSMACISRQHRIAPAIMGNADDVKDFLQYELQPRHGTPTPALLEGWRGELIGQALRDVLRGNLAIRVADVNETQPLEFVPVDQD